jgi:integrase
MGKRHQRGHIKEKAGAFYLIYRTTVDGVRKVVWHRLCTKDRKTGCGSKSATAVVEMAEDHMRTINGNQPSTGPVTVVDFWKNTYLPFITENLKASTVFGYQHVWDSYLKDHFGEVTLGDYRTPKMTNFLTSHAKTLRPRTLKHIKFLASGLFSHAVATGHCETNPIRDASVLGKTLPDGETGAYTLEEIEDIISALVECVECQLIMALCFFAGLRRGEIQGLQWGDIDNDFIHIRRNKIRGKVTTPKTESSVASIPIVQPVRGLLKLWRAKCPTTPDGWLFVKTLENTARLRIMPTLEKAGCTWRGFHAGRRGLGTKLRELTGNSTAGKNMLRHSGEVVTQKHYEKALPEEALRGMKLLEAEVKVKQ